MFASLKSHSNIAIVTIYIVIAVWSISLNLFTTNRIIVDAPSMCTYLPAVIIHHDLHLNYIDQNPEYYKDKIWCYRIENGNRLIKSSVGISVLLSPFFLVGHFIAILTSAEQTGYSWPYQNAMTIGVMIYLLIGLFFLRKFLLSFFDELTVALTLISIVLATNLLWYTTFEPFMSHAISFALISASMYYFHQWLCDGKPKNIFFFIILFGFICMVRPLSITLLIYFALYALLQHQSKVSSNLALLMKNIMVAKKAILFGSFIFLLLLSMQFFYWKYITGHWFFDVYINEHFCFNSPQIIPFLFSFRKGIFIYSPVLLFIIPGFFLLYKINKGLCISTLIFFLVTIYFLSSWWAWSYGISWGMRPIIEFYAILSMPMAAAFAFILKQTKAMKIILYATILALVTLNIFQTWQYKNGFIHFDDMSRAAYFKGFIQTEITDEWRDLLQPYQWERRLKGLPQIECDKNFLQNISPQQSIYLRAKNMKNISVNRQAQNVTAAYSNNTGAFEMFYVLQKGNDNVILQLKNGMVLSTLPNNENLITATNEQTVNSVFKIIFLGENEIALQTANGKYVTYENNFPHILRATATAIGKNETFRFLVKDE
nr:hypothetical protein [Bacteroidota bacterium]